MAAGAPPLLHLGLKDMADPILQFVSDTSLMVTEWRPIVIVEVFDDLKRPAAVKNIAAHDFSLEPISDRIMTGVTQFAARLAEHQVGVPDQLMEEIKGATGALDALQGLGNGADRRDRRVVHPGGAPALCSFDPSHRFYIPASAQNASF
jgi:hypothetical protein